MLEILQGIYGTTTVEPKGLPLTISEFQRAVEWARIHDGAKAPPRRPTAALVAKALHDELDFAEHMAREYNYDAPRDQEALKRRLLGTERHVLETRGLARRACGIPDELDIGDLDRSMKLESDHWTKRADNLRRELGPKFISGSRAVREAMVRDWVRGYRIQGRLLKRQPAV